MLPARVPATSTLVGVQPRHAILGALAIAVGVATGCAEERPPVTDGRDPSAGGPQFDTTVSTKPPGCGVTDDGSQCDCLDVPLYVDAPTMYFVLDRSASMRIPDKWTQVRITIGRLMRALGPRANFGATMYPGSADACAPGPEIMSVRNGDPPSSGVDGPTTTALLTATRVAPTGGTPTAATLEAVRGRLQSIAGRRFVILATDGAPNCNTRASCNFDQCQPNIEEAPSCPREGPFNCCDPMTGGFREHCNDAVPTLAAIAGLRAQGIPVYVIGLPGTTPYGPLLDQMAVEGGTARQATPRYYAVDSTSEVAMLAALKQIAAQIAGVCTFDLKEAPANPGLVNVYVDDALLPYEPVNGWSIEDRKVTLLGGACDRVKRGDVLDVRIISGCPRVEPR